MPVIFNATILNGMCVIGYVQNPPIWHPSDEEGNLLSIHFTYSEVIWPWTGLDYTNCPYSWLFCRQPPYAGAMPVIFNATILNGMCVIGYVQNPPYKLSLFLALLSSTTLCRCHACDINATILNGMCAIGYVQNPPIWHPSDEEGNLLSIHFTYSEVIWPWTGYLALHMQIKEEGAQFSGVIEGNVTLRIYSPPAQGERAARSSTCVLQLKLNVVPTPPQSKWVLWDQFHSIKYPPGYIPRDSLDLRNDILDWHRDHLHTNFHIIFNMLEMLAIMLIRSVLLLHALMLATMGHFCWLISRMSTFNKRLKSSGMMLLILGWGWLYLPSEWYNVDTMVKMRFFDDKTRSWWTPVTRGVNIPALNDLLEPFGIAFGDKILNGDFSIDGEQSRYASGADIVRFPRGGYVHIFPFLDSSESGATQNALLNSVMDKADSPILGLLEVGEGRMAVYGDSNCLDSSHMVTNCYWLLRTILDFTGSDIKDPVLFSESVKRDMPLYEDDNHLPSRRTDVNFSAYSAVMGKDLICQSDSRFEVWGTKGYNLHVRGRNKRLLGHHVIDLGRGLNSTSDTTRSKRSKFTEKNKAGCA